MYQLVPFPFAEVQAHLVALLWAKLLPNFPEHPSPPPNPSNPYSSAPTAPPESPPGSEPLSPLSQDPINGVDGITRRAKEIPEEAAPRKVLAMRRALVFGDPYEFTFSEYMFSLISEANDGSWSEAWKRIEPWRLARREDKALRGKVVGY